MPSQRVIRVRTVHDGVAATSLREGIAAIRAEQGIRPEFAPEVEEAAAAAAAAPRLPDLDRTDLDLITIDPEGSLDLDQAVHLTRAGDGGGFLVHYAIADVAAFVSPGDPVDLEAQRRGETYYAADSKVPLHPTVLSEDAASLLPDRVRPALLWTIRVDARGEGTGVQVERALVRSRARLSYREAQRIIDLDGTAGETPYAHTLGLLREVGELRLAREAERGGVNLPLPEQEIDIDGDTWRLEFRSQLPVEQWNAQISLLTGFAAATLMTQARVGVLRTLPPADPRDLQRLHRTARGLGLSWPAEQPHPEFIRSLDPADPAQAAMVVACTRLLRGSGYAAFEGRLPELTGHAALASDYAHVTAPLRRLADRYAGEICLALCAERPVPEWVRSTLPTLPDLMRSSGSRAGAYERAVLNLVEAGTLAPHVGEHFEGAIVEIDEKHPHRGQVNVRRPAVEARVEAAESRTLPLGERVRVRLAEADPTTRSVRFTLS
ncbi:RNB domain-containing ribonuclease [Nocardioides insulae]|uniref:RNB domain-containing ribonuclease n=1 Tax=Nocardioides insulae TaxID=394734 RepID=UPI00048F3893|nr:RNB domain-containing ribonuclease [Nocardioides insulae]